MAPRQFTAPTRSPASSTFFYYTNSVGLRSGEVTETQTWDHPMIWASGKDGSKLARAMIRPKSWSLPISTIGPPSTAGTVTLAVTRSWVCFLEELIIAARISLVRLAEEIHSRAVHFA